MNVNVSNLLYSGCVSGIGRFPVQFPNITSINSVVLCCPSGNLSPVYVGNSGVTVDLGCELLPANGINFSVDNASYIFAVSPSGFTNQIRYLIS